MLEAMTYERPIMLRTSEDYKMRCFQGKTSDVKEGCVVEGMQVACHRLSVLEGLFRQNSRDPLRLPSSCSILRTKGGMNDRNHDLFPKIQCSQALLDYQDIDLASSCSQKRCPTKLWTNNQRSLFTLEEESPHLRHILDS